MLATAGTVFFSNPQSKTARVNGTIYISKADGMPGSWQQAARVPGQVWKAGPGRPQDTFNFGYNMMALLPRGNSDHEGEEAAATAVTTAQLMGVIYQVSTPTLR